MPYVRRGTSGTDIRDGTVTLRELAQVSWTITAPMVDGVLTGPPTQLNGTMLVDDVARTMTMTIQRDGDGTPAAIVVNMTGFDGEPDVTFTFSPTRDADGNLIGQGLTIT